MFSLRSNACSLRSNAGTALPREAASLALAGRLLRSGGELALAPLGEARTSGSSVLLAVP